MIQLRKFGKGMELVGGEWDGFQTTRKKRKAAIPEPRDFINSAKKVRTENRTEENKDRQVLTEQSSAVLTFNN